MLLIIHITKPILTSLSWLIVFFGIYFREMEPVSGARRLPAA